ncbi:3-methylfumaryl-CoA hydratase [Novosphingobium chloroacetimidivorans]|uniref:3-methylfumaryl-CoA hydratase n=1 Tax=Novosphingobium chloroacetimidivorans TaxID=1428314 RepID=A0A7W7K9B4_9SPHN|nr:MaoC family dehydratase N-terminal domain-containing protein [Novosphingobium chloroacetimidivorans]MBB4858360.1 3-methylfumaryl-CoA hydratase [Novosphingobium chloroacetimidivorans]
MSDFDDWVGRSQASTDTLDCARSNALSVALGGEGALKAGDPLPLLHHWLYFWDVKPPAGLGQDGHPAKGGFLPPVPLPRRMWAGGRLTFHKPLLLGAQVTKTSTILSVNEKTGRTGTLVFVTVRHELDAGEGVAITEEQDLVYREPASASLPLPVAASAPQTDWLEQVDPDPVLLFRYSALTMNGHRIHYDRPYAIEEEAYPGLVVHGPLQATLLIALAERNLDAPITGFSFRGQQPAFDGVPLHVCGGPSEGGAEVWTQQGEAKNMVATVSTASAA